MVVSGDCLFQEKCTISTLSPFFLSRLSPAVHLCLCVAVLCVCMCVWKVRISGVGKTTEQLLRFIDRSEVPLEYLDDPCTAGASALGQHPQEVRVRVSMNTLKKRLG